MLLIVDMFADPCQVTECFAVPFTEKTDEHSVAIVQDHHKLMYAFHRRNNKKEVIVGWFATATAQGELINDNSSLIHDFFCGECQNALHIVVDTMLLSDTAQVRGFVRKEMKVSDQLLANTFQEVTVRTVFSDAEAACFSLMMKSNSKLPTSSATLTAPLRESSEHLQGSLEGLRTLVLQLQQYVDQVAEGRMQGSREVGVQISQALHTFTQQPLSAEQCQALQTRYQDLLMVAYLSTLTQTQTLVAEKLNQIL